MTLQELKAGDEIVLYTGRVLELSTVLRVTPKQVIVKWYTGAEMGFKKDTGKGIGMWNEKTIYVATEEMKERMICEAMYEKLYMKQLFVPKKDYKIIKEVYNFLKERALIS